MRKTTRILSFLTPGLRGRMANWNRVGGGLGLLVEMTHRSKALKAQRTMKSGCERKCSIQGLTVREPLTATEERCRLVVE